MPDVTTIRDATDHDLQFSLRGTECDITTFTGVLAFNPDNGKWAYHNWAVEDRPAFDQPQVILTTPTESTETRHSIPEFVEGLLTGYFRPAQSKPRSVFVAGTVTTPETDSLPPIYS